MHSLMLHWFEMNATSKVTIQGFLSCTVLFLNQSSIKLYLSVGSSCYGNIFYKIKINLK